MKNAVIIVAAGSGKRFGNKVPKQFLNLNEKPVFLWSVDVFASIKSFKQIIVVFPPNMVKPLSLKYKTKFVCATGGNERFDSVKNGLALVEDDVDYIAVHDAARPLISKKDILLVLKEATKTKAAIAVERTKDTIKLVSISGHILKTLDRTVLRNAQTPQIFEAKLLKKAYSKKISTNITDDSKLVENLKVNVSVVEMSSLNFKITTKQDFDLAAAIITNR
ncbi:MAG: 2-C-methyl-D-erythritol 4-phosphate cytidylyltransferase [Endomicrobium sp.]|jgi:2-C-methyl-D-erythritol 4-phosphate cytidylyltransferase|nr:2-C-methyl-D-erythritol 4-phosphate cytidylyltransferase [Endomicrobium sp.]